MTASRMTRCAGPSSRMPPAFDTQSSPDHTASRGSNDGNSPSRHALPPSDPSASWRGPWAHTEVGLVTGGYACRVKCSASPNPPPPHRGTHRKVCSQRRGERRKGPEARNQSAEASAASHLPPHPTPPPVCSLASTGGVLADAPLESRVGRTSAWDDSPHVGSSRGCDLMPCT